MAYNDIIDETDRHRIDNLQVLQERIINDLTEKGIPTDKDDRVFLLEAMKLSDKTIFGKAKIKVADKSNENNQNAASMIADILSRHMVKQTTPRTSVPELDHHIKVTDLVDGETSVGQLSINYDEFIN